MKYLMIIAIVLGFVSASEAKTIKDGEQEYSCTPVKTCDERLKSAYAEISRLKKQLKEQSSKEVVKEKVVYAERVVEKETTKIKKHIISVIAHKSVQDVTTDRDTTGPEYSAEAKVNTGYVPALTYQYQFDMGLVPMIGIDITKKSGLILGLGFEF